MKPIAMRCDQQQFDAIKPKLEQIEGFKIKDISNFEDNCYLVNNYDSYDGIVSNLPDGTKGRYNRIVYKKWDEQIFLDACGYKPKLTLDDAYVVKCDTEIQADEVASYIKGRNYKADRFRFIINHKGLLNYHSDDGNLWDHVPDKAAHLPVLTYQEWKQLKDNKPMTKQRLIVPVQDVLEIHKIACASWKTTIATYLSRANFYQEIKFTQNEVDKMFKAATPEQLPVLERIFGKKAKEIQWDKIKSGSKVMIKYDGQHCYGFEYININEPVDVVFYKTKHFISYNNKYHNGHNSSHDSYITFHQNGNYCMFASDKHTDYITEVIEY